MLIATDHKSWRLKCNPQRCHLIAFANRALSNEKQLNFQSKTATSTPPRHLNTFKYSYFIARKRRRQVCYLQISVTHADFPFMCNAFGSYMASKWGGGQLRPWSLGASLLSALHRE